MPAAPLPGPTIAFPAIVARAVDSSTSPKARVLLKQLNYFDTIKLF
jgi:hypothetical protein